jgi:hypothetical protein
MGNVFLRASAIILSVSCLLVAGSSFANAPAAAAPAGGGGSKCVQVQAQVTAQGQCSNSAQISESMSACMSDYEASLGSARSNETYGRQLQATAGKGVVASNAATGNGQGQTAVGANTAAGVPAAQANKPASDCRDQSSVALGYAATYNGLVETANKYCGGTAKPLDSAPAKNLNATCSQMLVENKGIMAGLSKAALPLAALAAGAIGGYMLGKSSGGDDGGDSGDDETETTPPAGAEPAAPAEDTCGENAEKNAAGLCVVKSEDDTCYAADGKTEDKSKVRDSKGVCVSTSSLCETGYQYDTVNKVCKKSTCGTGATENEAGECISNGTGGGTVAVGTPDPIIGEDLTKTEDEETLAEKLAKNKAKTSGSGSSSSSGAGSARNAAAAPSSGKGSGSFQASGGGSGGGGAGAGFSGGSFAANGGGGADGAGGKDAEVQYQPVKWANPKKDRPLRNVLRK